MTGTSGPNPAAPAAGLVVDAVRTWVVERPYRRPFRISSGGSESLTSLLVEVVAGDRRGVGEAAPMTAYTGETLAGLRAAVAELLAPALVCHPLHGIAEAHAVMDATVRGQHLAKAALDIALHDLVASAAGVPVHVLLGGAVREWTPIAWVIGLGDPDEVVAEADEYAANGFTHIKVKGGLDPARDVRLVRALRDTLPAGVEISLDANEGYSRVAALPALRELDDAGLSLVEQPLPRWDLAGLAELRQRVRMPVMADESVQSIHDALAVIRAGAADIINIKILKVGGLYRARQVMALAEAAGLAVKVGSMPELEVATLAGLHLAAGALSGAGAIPRGGSGGDGPGAALSGAGPVPADLVGPLLVTGGHTTAGPFGAGRGGYLPTPAGPGLGHDLPPGPVGAGSTTSGREAGLQAERG